MPAADRLSSKFHICPRGFAELSAAVIVIRYTQLVKFLTNFVMIVTFSSASGLY